MTAVVVLPSEAEGPVTRITSARRRCRWRDGGERRAQRAVGLDAVGGERSRVERLVLRALRLLGIRARIGSRYSRRSCSSRRSRGSRTWMANAAAIAEHEPGEQPAGDAQHRPRRDRRRRAGRRASRPGSSGRARPRAATSSWRDLVAERRRRRPAPSPGSRADPAAAASICSSIWSVRSATACSANALASSCASSGEFARARIAIEVALGDRLGASRCRAAIARRLGRCRAAPAPARRRPGVVASRAAVSTSRVGIGRLLRQAGDHVGGVLDAGDRADQQVGLGLVDLVGGGDVDDRDRVVVSAMIPSTSQRARAAVCTNRVSPSCSSGGCSQSALGECCGQSHLRDDSDTGRRL